MLVFSQSTKINICGNVTDMRKSFNTLAALVKDVLQSDPLDGSMYVFWNKGKNKLKILQWEDNGFWLYYKNLCRGKFFIPDLSGNKIEVSATEFNRMLSGFDIRNVQRLDIGVNKQMF